MTITSIRVEPDQGLDFLGLDFSHDGKMEVTESGPAFIVEQGNDCIVFLIGPKEHHWCIVRLPEAEPACVRQGYAEDREALESALNDALAELTR